MPGNRIASSSASSLAALVAASEMGDTAAPLLQEQDGLESYVRRLVEHEQFTDAVRLLAVALPRREGIWWAWVCARRASGESPPPKIQGALDGTERWIREPGEEHRRQSMALAEAADLGTPAGSAALAAFLSGGSIAPPDAPEVAPPEHAAAKAIAGSIIMSAVAREPEKAPETFREFIDQGLVVANKLGLSGREPS